MLSLICQKGTSRDAIAPTTFSVLQHMRSNLHIPNLSPIPNGLGCIVYTHVRTHPDILKKHFFLFLGPYSKDLMLFQIPKILENTATSLFFKCLLERLKLQLT